MIFRAVLGMEDGGSAGVRLCSRNMERRVAMESKPVVPESKVLQKMSPSG